MTGKHCSPVIACPALLDFLAYARSLEGRWIMQNKAILIVGPLLFAACTASDNYSEIIARSTPPGAALKPRSSLAPKNSSMTPPRSAMPRFPMWRPCRMGCKRLRPRRQQDVSGRYLGLHSIGIPIRDGKIAGGSWITPSVTARTFSGSPFPSLSGFPAPKRSPVCVRC